MVLPVAGAAIGAMGGGSSALSSIGGAIGKIGSALGMGGGGDGIDVSENRRLARALRGVNLGYDRLKYDANMTGMRKAGLNPILAAGYGGQQSGGASPITPNLSSQVESKRQKFERMQMLANVNQTNAQTDLIKSTQQKVIAETKTEAEKPNLLRGQLEKLAADTNVSRYQLDYMHSQMEELHSRFAYQMAKAHGQGYQNVEKGILADFYGDYQLAAIAKEMGLKPGDIISMVKGLGGVKKSIPFKKGK